MNDRDLRKLFQAAGHDQPARDLTDRIMAQVAVTRIAQPTVVKPLISKWGWAGIAAGAALLLLAALLASGPATAEPALPYVGAIADWFSRMRLPAGQWPQWVIGSSLLALFFAVLTRRAERGQTA